jgi:3-hydroxyacyl-[acyl-carrier-protein] dehydratase
MRWFWIDKFVEFESGRRAVAVKNVSYAEEQIPDYAFGFPVMPASLIIEGLAQTGGLLVGELSGFRDRVVLAKVGKAIFHDHVEAGDTLTYTAEIEDVRSGGSIVHATAHVGERLLVEADIVFAHLDDRFEGVELFDPAMFLGALRSYKLYDVGKKADGSPLEPPQHMLEAENAVYADGS